MERDPQPDSSEHYACDGSILNVVESLGEQLQSTDVEERRSAVLQLTQNLQRSKNVNLDEALVLLEFYTAKLSDNISIVPATLDGLSRLISLPLALPPETICRISRELFHSSVIQGLKPADRYNAYVLLGKLLDSYLDALLPQKSEFVLGFIQSIDGEKDPRNLLYLFRLYTVVGHTFDLGPLVEDFFDVIACYHPVNYEPPANDPYGISNKDLTDALTDCLLSTKRFGPHLLELLIDRVTGPESDQPAGFELLLSALERFGRDFPIENEALNIWNSFRKQLILGGLIHDDLNAVTRAFGAFAAVVFGTTPINETLLSQMISDCERFLYYPLTGEGFAKASNEVLRILSENTKNYVVQRIFPALVQKTASNPPVFLPLLAPWTKICSEFGDNFERDIQAILEILNNLTGERETETDSGDAEIVIHDQILLIYAQLMTDELKIDPVPILRASLELDDELTNLAEFCSRCFEVDPKSIESVLDLVLKSGKSHHVRSVACALSEQTRGAALEWMRGNASCFTVDVLAEFCTGLMVKPYSNADIVTSVLWLKPLFYESPREGSLDLYAQLCREAMRQAEHKRLAFQLLYANSQSNLRIFSSVLPFCDYQDLLKIYSERSADLLTDLECTSILLNRLPVDEVSTLLPKCAPHMNDTEHKAFLARSLLVRNHRSGFEMLTDVLSTISLPSPDTVQFLEVVLTRDENLVNASPLAAAKVWHQIAKSLVDLGDVSNPHVCAIVGLLLKHCPAGETSGTLKKLVPILVKSVESDGQSGDSLLPALSALQAQIDDVPREDVPGLVQKLLELGCDGNQVMEVRKLSLAALQSVAKRADATTLLPLKKKCLLSLRSAVEDKKRLVRNSAVAARNDWFLVGETV